MQQDGKTLTHMRLITPLSVFPGGLGEVPWDRAEKPRGCGELERQGKELSEDEVPAGGQHGLQGKHLEQGPPPGTYLLQLGTEWVSRGVQPLGHTRLMGTWAATSRAYH